MNIAHKATGLLLYGIFKLSGYLPLRVLYLKADVLAFLFGRVFRYRYQVVVQNLSRSFPDKNYKEIRALVRSFYRHFFRVFAEVVRSQGMSEAEAKQRFAIKNPELIRQLHDNKNNIIALGGHTGNWEWLIMTPLFFSFSIYTLYKPLSSGTAEVLMAKIRRRFGLKLLTMQQAGRYILSKQDFPALYFFVGDQSPSHRNTEYRFGFLNQPSFFFNGGARLATATGSAVIYQSINRIKPGYYEITHQLISVPGDGMTDREILRKYVSLLEADIQRQPECWLWSHKRWKHRADTP